MRDAVWHQHQFSRTCNEPSRLSFVTCFARKLKIKRIEIDVAMKLLLGTARRVDGKPR